MRARLLAHYKKYIKPLQDPKYKAPPVEAPFRVEDLKDDSFAVVNKLLEEAIIDEGAKFLYDN